MTPKDLAHQFWQHWPVCFRRFEHKVHLSLRPTSYILHHPAFPRRNLFNDSAQRYWPTSLLGPIPPQIEELLQQARSMQLAPQSMTIFQDHYVVYGARDRVRGADIIEIDLNAVSTKAFDRNNDPALFQELLLMDNDDLLERNLLPLSSAHERLMLAPFPALRAVVGQYDAQDPRVSCFLRRWPRGVGLLVKDLAVEQDDDMIAFVKTL